MEKVRRGRPESIIKTKARCIRLTDAVYELAKKRSIAYYGTPNVSRLITDLILKNS